MVQLSRRLANVKSSPTVALNAKAKALAKDGIRVLNFTVGEPDFATPEAIVDKAVAALKAGRTKYGPAGGGLEFRQAIAAKLKRDNGLDFPAEQIVCGMGAKEILFHIFMAVLNDGDECLVPAPYWVSYPDQILAAGAKPVILPLGDDIAEHPLTVESLKRHATDKTRCLILNSPNNPAGYMFDDKLMRELGNYLKDKPWWIVSDEIYEYMSFDRPHVSLLAMFPELRDRFILVNGMSKGFAMTGWRVGYCAGPDAPMKMVRDLQSHSSTCLPPFIEEAATFAIAQGRSLLAPQIDDLKARRDYALELLKGNELISVAHPHGAFYLFLDVRKGLAKAKTKIDGYGLCDHLLLKHHVAAVPGEAFGAPGYLRISYTTDRQTIADGLSRITKALGELAV